MVMGSKLLVYAVALVLCSGTANATTLYKCEMKAGVMATPQGNIKPVSKWMLLSPITVDTVSGIVRYGERELARERWRTVQKFNAGTGADWMLERDWPHHTVHLDAIIRITDGGDAKPHGPRIIWYGNGEMRVGVCERLD